MSMIPLEKFHDRVIIYCSSMICTSYEREYFLAKGMVKLMNFKKLVSAAAAAAITLSAAVTSFAADVSLTWSSGSSITPPSGTVDATSTATLTDSISTGVVEMEFDLLLRGGSGNASYIKAYSGGDEIMSIRRDNWSGGYYATSPMSDDTTLTTSSPQDEAIHFEVTMDFDNNTYTISGTDATTYNGKIAENAALTSLELKAGRGTAYDGVINTAQVTNLKVTHTTPATVTFNEAKTFGESTEYEGTATAVKFTVTPGDGTVTGIDVTYEGTTKSIETPTLTGNGAAVCGIVVGRVIDVTSENFSTVFDIDVK